MTDDKNKKSEWEYRDNPTSLEEIIQKLKDLREKVILEIDKVKEDGELADD